MDEVRPPEQRFRPMPPVVLDRFIVALEGTVLPHEGRRVNDPDDPGGATDFGISLRFLRAQGLDIDGDGDVDADDVWALEREDVAGLYRQFFWDMVHGDRLRDVALATKLFDTAVNTGPQRAIKIAQAAAGVDVDGVLGPQTFRALNVEDPRTLLDRICARQLSFYQGIVAGRPVAVKYLSGWSKRALCTVHHPCRICGGRRAL